MIKADANQRDIAAALRKAGCFVEMIQSATGRAGTPDLLVGNRGKTYLLEVKRPKAKGQQAGELSPAQEAWHAAWRGWPVAVVRTVEEALKAVGAMR